ncbi:MAG: immunoglobulin domain-containing protein, partial [Bacteroidota bacterium]
VAIRKRCSAQPTNAQSILRDLKRRANQWTESYSFDGTTYTPAVTFSYNLTVGSVGPFVGNAGGSAPPFTGLVDYFFNTTSPVLPEDGGFSAVAPIITGHAANQTVFEGRTATFTVTAVGTAPLSYQWQRDSVDIAGATSPAYTIAAVTLADSAATFRCVVSNALGSVTSNSAVLVVIPLLPPTITTHPTDQTVMLNQTVAFNVVAGGNAPLFYQWQRDSVDIPGATSSSYTTPPATSADSGATFRCAVSNIVDIVTSTSATLKVKVPGPAINVVSNPGFESGTTSWSFYTDGGGSFSTVSPGFVGSAAAKLDIAGVGSNVQLYQANIPLEANTNYQLSFVAYSTTGNDLSVTLQQHDAPYINYGLSSYVVDLTT